MSTARSASDRLRIVVLGYVVRGPLAGFSWHHMHYVLGLAELGHEVFYLEDSDDYPSCYDPVRNLTDCDPTYGLSFADRFFRGVGRPDSWGYYDAHRSAWFGPLADRADEIWTTADVVLNFAGINPIRPWMDRVPVRVFIDTDPVFIQARHAADPRALALARQHNVFFSFGENVDDLKRVVDDGLDWMPTRQPIALSHWPAEEGAPDAAFTTVMQWDSYAAVEIAGRAYGMKSLSFEPYLDLPRRTHETLEIAIAAPPAPLEGRGWRFRNAIEVTIDPWGYQDYIRGSKGEFGLAKHAYVASGSGWFSERSACYLACGRPVVVQDTGFSRWLDADAGVLPFSSPDQAVAQLEAVSADHARHCAAARAVCEEWFDSRKVLSSLLERACARVHAAGLS